uniref:UPF0502 protein n=1 Tax=Heterorhabditis bacteriophora TaxID=37862 RepID=A0A1I7XT78_HETBA
MDRMQTAIEQIVNEISNSLMKPNRLYHVVKECGERLSREDMRSVLREVADRFRTRSFERIALLIEECEIEEKLSGLRVLLEESEETNKQLGLTAGFRPVGPTDDLAGSIDVVLNGYEKTLAATEDDLDTEIEEKRIELTKARAKVCELAELVESHIGRI